MTAEITTFPRFSRQTVASEMQERRRHAIRTDPDGGAWESAGFAALNALLHNVDQLRLSAYQQEIVREARMLRDNYRDAVRRYQEEGR